MNPRIYTYKITFEEVPYYYYGVHKEKRFDEYYMGSPVTHKWCWEFYTPKKQILELFEYSDCGWLDANLVEDRLIKPFLNDDFCLNEGCGGIISFKSRSKGGKTQSRINMERGVGFYGMSKKDRSEASKRGGLTQGKISKEFKLGIFGMDKNEKQRVCSEAGKIGSKVNKENKAGIFALTKEQLSENGKKGGKRASEKINKQKWKCLETGYITTYGPLTLYQRHRGIDVSLRERIE